jgi:hypothetical protein
MSVYANDGRYDNLAAHLVTWCKQENGFNDLLIFLKIVFGTPESR